MLYKIDTSHLLTKVPFNKLRNTFISHSVECSNPFPYMVHYKQYFLSVCQPDREARKESVMHVYPLDPQRSLRKQLRTPGLGPILGRPGLRGQGSK